LLKAQSPPEGRHSVLATFDPAVKGIFPRASSK